MFVHSVNDRKLMLFIRGEGEDLSTAEATAFPGLQYSCTNIVQYYNVHAAHVYIYIL